MVWRRRGRWRRRGWSRRRSDRYVDGLLFYLLCSQEVEEEMGGMEEAEEVVVPWMELGEEEEVGMLT